MNDALQASSMQELPVIAHISPPDDFAPTNEHSTSLVNGRPAMASPANEP